MDVADFHCDLLWYLANDAKRTVYDPESQSSVSMFKEGRVAVQTFPIFTITGKSSVKEGMKQFEIFQRLSKLDPDFFGPTMRYKLAIENASGFCNEEEPLEEGLRRVERWWTQSPIYYISLTWNQENRFGGGVDTQVGLKEDGRRLLQWMSGRKIAVDLSHASDRLAEDILKEIKKWDVIPIASHSNFRAVCPHPRNLPDHLAQGIAQEGGLIGLNMVRHFIGENGPHAILLHLEYAHRLKIENHLCLGADFFGEIDLDRAKMHLKPYFFEGFSNSACYPQLRKILSSSCSDEYIDNLMYSRLNHFLETYPHVN